MRRSAGSWVYILETLEYVEEIARLQGRCRDRDELVRRSTITLCSSEVGEWNGMSPKLGICRISKVTRHPTSLPSDIACLFRYYPSDGSKYFRFPKPIPPWPPRWRSLSQTLPSPTPPNPTLCTTSPSDCLSAPSQCKSDIQISRPSTTK